MANWEELPQDVLELVGRLAIEDYLAFRRVCTSWRSATAKETYNAKSKAPWFMIYARNQTPQFSSPSRGRIIREMVPRSQGQTLSTPGWMLVSKLDRDYHIFNPLSSISIELPALEKLRHKSCLDVELDQQERLLPPRIDRIAVSSSPSSRNYTVMVSISIHRDLRPPELAFHRSGEDAWTVISPAKHLPWSIALQLIHYDWLYVALDAHNRIMTLNERKCRMQLRLVLGQNFRSSQYLMESSGSLLVAWKIRGEENGPVKSIRVFRVDLEKGTQEEVKSLGNASLFLNDYSSSSFSVEFDAKSRVPGIKPNHVYFTEYKKKKSCSMADGKVGTYFDGTSRDYYAANWFRPDFLTFFMLKFFFSIPHVEWEIDALSEYLDPTIEALAL